ncbi:SusC/RagA family TonB-linked outer membrane protein [Hymenobacter sp. UV11]|uniref:SusC/RagA family TonB-linked outer membrane protein n=1 Tax=Hymenobacter sp. UV11 TaxID=1849735 RepID=UPI001060A8CF|nr:SusC/RagA family TonB-linked outer membrane protein [Hymenobacter sp. UV11]TDN40158.1 SusC/RagA family protein [Hymenobacter sp. UV11]TFZ64840.1 SusC/RagA family TonB-linked outer membrane protein [Hymenobacter sp. UV11]
MKHSYLVKLRFLLLLILGLSASLGAWAQATTGSVSGRVADAKNEGLPGVTVLIEGTSVGGSTNADGTYTIAGVPAGPHTLIISFIGYTTSRVPVTVTAGSTTSVPAQLLGENATALGEAVVIGYGTQRRQDLTGAVEQIDSKQFVKGQVTNPEQLIQGKVAGVQITTGGGAPGSNSQILIRGGSSLSASNQPLIVIDGVPVDNTGISGASNPLSLINPNDIESITVLKDASSTAIYGVRASNGVILVTTKRGVQGDSFHASASTLQSISTPVKYVDVLNADEFRALVNAKGSASQKASLGTANTDWQREIYRNAYSADNNVSISGAAGILPYRISTGYLYQEGILKRNDLKRYTGSLTLNPVLLNGSLKINLNLKGSWIDNNFSDQGAVGAAVLYDPTQPITSTDAKYAPYGGYYQFLDPSGNGQLNSLATLNPVGLINQRRDRSTVKRSIGNIQLDYKIPFITGLSANVNLGYDVQRGRGTVNAATNAAAFYNQRGANNYYAQDLNNTLLEAYGRYEHSFGSNSKLEFLAGYSYQKFENRNYIVNNYSADGTIFQQPVAPAYNGEYTTLDTNVLEGYYTRLNLNFSEKYLLTGTFRADGTSRFNPNHFGYFPSGAFAWRIKGEEFLKNSTAISDLKLRVGYGQTGQQDLGGSYYPYLANLGLSTLTAQYQLGNQFYQTLRPNQYNPNITWETTTTYNAGLDYGFFDGRLYGSFDVYQRDTKNLLFFTNIPALSGLSNAGNFNVGSLTNKGVEAIVNLDLVKGDRLNITVNANATYNHNEITKLSNSNSSDDVGQKVGGISGGVGNTIQVNSVGYSANTFYMQQQVYGQNGKPLEGVYVDRNGNGSTADDFYRYKSGRPNYILGGGANMSYKGLNVAFTLRANLGNYIYNNQRSQAFYDATSNGYASNKNREVLNSGFTSSQIYSDYFLENGSFLRMQNATLGYNFGELIKKGTNLSLSLAVQNVFVITKYTGLDPEIVNFPTGSPPAPGIDQTIYPRPRTFTVGLNLGI